jgi:probable F420-dependent oxidoreductase
MSPTIGLHAPNMFAGADPATAVRIARLAEELGYDSLLVVDHVVLPRPQTSDAPVGPDTPLLDPVVALTYYTAHTERILLGTGCIVLPQRDPVVLAKQLASVDVLSGGRLLFGVGVGYLAPELAALGVPMAERGARTDEYLGAMRSLWYDENPSYQGKFVNFDQVDAFPRPSRRIPVLIGGHTAPAHRRAAVFGDEWFGYQVGLHAAEQQLASLRAAVDNAPPRAAPLRISICPSRPLTPQRVAEYAALGVHRLVVAPPFGITPDEFLAFIERNAPQRLGAARHDQG